MITSIQALLFEKLTGKLIRHAGEDWLGDMKRKFRVFSVIASAFLLVCGAAGLWGLKIRRDRNRN